MMSECFKELDADKSGTVDARELLEAVEMVDMHEADGWENAAGSCKGCMGGCLRFWCCCHGLKALYCGKMAKEPTLKPHKGRDDHLLAHISSEVAVALV